MAVQVVCKCGETYSLKDEFAGTLVTCPTCGATSRAPSVKPQADPAFDRDKFLLHQKHWSIKEKYYVWDEQGNQVLYVERPAHIFRNLLAVFGGFIAAAATFVILGALAGTASGTALEAPLALTTFLGSFAVLLVVGTALSKKRHVTFYRDDDRGEKLLEILQDHKFWILNASYTVRDKRGLGIARLRKNYLYNILRKRWYCERPTRALWCMAKEDSIILSLLRRLLGPFFGLLRTNFVIYAADGEGVLGEFNRKATLLDRYVLDLSADPQRSLDRRVALALGVMLDTGERR